MKIDFAAVRDCLKSYDFGTLFREHLGWDHHQATLEIPLGDEMVPLEAVAHKRGFVAYLCREIPDREKRMKIDHQVAKSAREHIIIYADEAAERQVWQWVRREPGKPAASRDHQFHSGQTGTPLIQRLERIAVSLEEEEEIDLLEVTDRARAAFDADRITKRFFDRFKREHQAFLKFIKGIKAEGDLEWYTSLMLNRLMFVYFIQKKGFLDGDADYLRNRLAMVKAARGDDRFQSFYRYFLLRLFHEGLGASPEERELDSEMERLLGRVPYLNGGFFEVHELERKYSNIEIPDEAFEKLFDFFDQYSWHLDERPLRADNEINPDVVGYIFEKFINQKQMGAYYTKEDITDYISKNTIIPYLFDTVRKKQAKAFDAEGPIWRMLRDAPDRYIYQAVRHGVLDKGGNVIPLPEEIEAGVADVGKRQGWNRLADEPFRLPMETWREHVARRQRCLEIREKLRNGDVHEINDLITLNLDIWQFARDVVVNAETPELLRDFWKAIQEITVLDPTCGSGAFLFAALRILETLYADCLERMGRFIGDLDGTKAHPKKYGDFKSVLEQIGKHPNERYFILKSIILNNLFGVDIMEEAVEICKLRLFLKLVAQVERVEEIEPLPDIDFNIRAGNALVGYATEEQARRAFSHDSTGQGQLMFDERTEAFRKFEESLENVEKAFRNFREQQVSHGGSVTAREKQELRQRLGSLGEELNRYLAEEYGVNLKKKKEYESWKESHQPFHWFVEFFSIMKSGGFSVIIGNPPYVVYSESRVGYKILSNFFNTIRCKNLYAYVFEQAANLAPANAYLGLIIQLTILSSGKMLELQDLLIRRGSLYALAFPRRPESMFDGVEMPVAILLSAGAGKTTFSSRIFRFYSEEREFALENLSFKDHKFRFEGYRIGKIGYPIASKIVEKLLSQNHSVAHMIGRTDENKIYYQEACRYWVKACLGYPFFKRNGEKIPPPHGRTLNIKSQEGANFIACLLNSSLFYWFYSTFSDCEHINDSLVRNFPIPSQWSKQKWLKEWNRLSESLDQNALDKTIQTQQGHVIEYREINAAASKKIIDKIDELLANFYSFNQQELDFIINYDIKYRMGGPEEAEEGESI